MEGNLQKKGKFSYRVDEDEDRLSSLPDEIIHDILSRLPFESAITTGVLSRRWLGLWKELKSLKVEKTTLGFYGCHRFFFSVIDHVLHQLSSTQIDTFDFHFPLPPFQEFQLFESLIRQICLQNVKELKVTFPDYDYDVTVILPSVVLESQQLEVLVLGFSLCFQLPENGVNLPRLRKLDICVCDSLVEFVSKLVECCPVLEDLKIHGGLNFDVLRLRCLRICAPNLKSLSLSMIYQLELTQVLIDAPKLESFYVKDDQNLTKYCFVRNPNQLQTVVVNSMCRTGKQEWQFVKSIGNNVRYLVLQGRMCRAFYHMNDYGLPKFDLLTNLELVLHFPAFWKALAHFLQFCPNLQTVTLTRTGFTWYGTGWIELDIVPACLSCNVKRIWLKNFHGMQQETELIRYILMVVKGLERLHVTVAAASDSVKPTSLQLRKKFEFCKGLYRLPKSSSICQISVTGPYLPQ